MLLRNYDNFITSITSCGTLTKWSSKPALHTDKSVFGDGHINLKDTTGRIMGMTPNSYSMVEIPLVTFTESDNSHTSSSGSSLIIGGGTDEVSYDDYCLSSVFSNSQVGYVSGSQTLNRSYNETEKCWETTYTRTLTALEDLTITEIGIKQSGRQGSEAFTTLVYRELFENPVVASASANIKLTFVMKVYANPNKPADYVATASVE